MKNSNCQASGLKNQSSPRQEGRARSKTRAASYRAADSASISEGRRISGMAATKITSTTM